MFFLGKKLGFFGILFFPTANLTNFSFLFGKISRKFQNYKIDIINP